MSRIVALLASLALASALSATTYYVAPSGADDADRDGLTAGTAWASLSYACSRVPDGDHVIRLAAGLYVAEERALPPVGVTIEGAGADRTEIRAAETWALTPGLRPTGNNDYEAGDYLVAFESFRDRDGRGGPLTIRGIRFTSPTSRLLDGAILLGTVHDVVLEDLEVEDFAWAGINLVACERVAIRRCTLRNASRVREGERSGSLRFYVLRDSEITDSRFVTSARQDDGKPAVDVKGFYPTDVRIHGCDFRTPDLWNFDIEVPFSESYGVEIYENEFDGVISIPRAGGQEDPRTRGHDETFWIHHNRFTNSWSIEGAQEYLRVSHNFFDIPDDQLNGRIYIQFGAASTTGPQWWHDNVVVGADRSFLYKESGRMDSVYVYHNTVYYRDAENRTGDMLGVRGKTRGWFVENNVFVADVAAPRRIGANLNCADCPAEDIPTFRNNVFVNVAGEVPEGNFAEVDPGFALAGVRPDPYFRPASADAFVVDRGRVLPYAPDRAFGGLAPDLGSVEFETTSAAGLPTRGTASDLRVYPNPIGGPTLQVATADAGTYELVDVRGRRLRAGALPAGVHALEVGDLPAGSYYLRVVGSGGAVTVRSVVRL